MKLSKLYSPACTGFVQAILEGGEVSPRRRCSSACEFETGRFG
jgi:hypothetical protein